MTATLDTQTTRRELDHRSSDGIDVTLTWSPTANAVHVRVVEACNSFELDVRPEEALDAFNHPYAYAARASASVQPRRYERSTTAC